MISQYGRAAAVSVTLLLAACSGGDESEPGAAQTSDAADDQVVLALDEFAALHALSLGVQPDTVLEVFGYETTTAIFDDLGLERTAYGADLDVETIAALQPDVIVGVSIPTTVAVQDQLEDIAPTTILDYTAGWEEQLDAAAEALAAEDEAAAVRERVAEHTETLAADLADAGLDGTTVSVVGDNGGFFSPPTSTAVGSVLEALGLSRPAAQQAAGDPSSPFVVFSAETLAEHDGERIYVFSGGPYTTEGLTGSPLWAGLGAVQDGAVAEVSGEMWLAPSAFSLQWVLDDVRATLLDGADPASPAEAPERLSDFLGD